MFVMYVYKWFLGYGKEFYKMATKLYDLYEERD